MLLLTLTTCTDPSLLSHCYSLHNHNSCSLQHINWSYYCSRWLAGRNQNRILNLSCHGYSQVACMTWMSDMASMMAWHDGAMTWWCHDMMVPWLDGAMTWWRHDMMVPWHDGAMTWWRHDMMAPWHDGAMTWWRHDMMAPWHDGAMTWWRHDIVVTSTHTFLFRKCSWKCGVNAERKTSTPLRNKSTLTQRDGLTCILHWYEIWSRHQGLSPSPVAVDPPPVSHCLRPPQDP